ncbi:MAG: hypothetical protein IJM76_07660 [Lachnospiraceae bacterium]|nr:hypothetical protein [Lachnospiraceae bacterium]
MNKRELVKAAFRGEEVERVPVCMWKHVPQEFWADDDAFVKCQIDFYKATDVDFMKLSGDKYFPWPDPVLENIESADALYQMKPLGPDHPYIRGQIERTKKVVAGLNGECVALYLIFVPLSYLRLRIGYPKMMQFIRENPDAMKYACNVIAGDVKLLVKGIIEEAGADGIFYSVQNGEVDRFTAEEYKNWIEPSDKEVLDYANSLSDMNAIHFCAWEDIPNRLESWSGYHAPVISWSRYIDVMDIDEAKKKFGATVWGGFDNREGTLLYTGTREEIEAEVKSLIQQGGKKGYILGSDCSIHDDCPEEHIRWVVEAARKYSEHPLIRG